ncbi:uncharacterized protein LOC107500100 isoform X1 [Rousettus aegyptiacus]|uniref:uncharacterized protein LOC107500100 isoform X1 n=1 Tax=Rousettus aegyptiacus TaxID=9407 RepID=UPI00168CAD35|nr:uncharacterized protein LOC107500100 isoform X1 [Rousettus aegyptiacus]
MCVGRELLRDVPLTRAEVPSQLPFIRWASANHHCSCKVGRGVNYLMSGTGRRNQAWIALPLLLSFFRESATGREHISCMQILFKKSIGKTPFMKTPGRQFLHKTRSYRFRMALPLFSYPRLTCPSRATHFRGPAQNFYQLHLPVGRLHCCYNQMTADTSKQLESWRGKKKSTCNIQHICKFRKCGTDLENCQEAPIPVYFTATMNI